MTDVIASVLMLAGGVLALIAATGLHRFGDVFARMHAATKPATLGLALLLGGTAIVLAEPGPVAKVLLVIMLQFTTGPVGAHLVGRATFQAGTELHPDTAFDEESAARLRPR